MRLRCLGGVLAGVALIDIGQFYGSARDLLDLFGQCGDLSAVIRSFSSEFTAKRTTRKIYGVAGGGAATVKAKVAVCVTKPELEISPESPVATIVTGVGVTGALLAAVSTNCCGDPIPTVAVAGATPTPVGRPFRESMMLPCDPLTAPTVKSTVAVPPCSSVTLGSTTASVKSGLVLLPHPHSPSSGRTEAASTTPRSTFPIRPSTIPTASASLKLQMRCQQNALCPALRIGGSRICRSADPPRLSVHRLRRQIFAPRSSPQRSSPQISIPRHIG
jgi:hypothetical protein